MAALPTETQAPMHGTLLRTRSCPRVPERYTLGPQHAAAVRIARRSPSCQGLPPRITSRAFTDTVGVEWTVREIGNPTMTETLARVLDRDRRRGGWLVFESSDGDKRRLAPYPPDWRTVSLFELERWCMKATRVPPAPARRAED